MAVDVSADLQLSDQLTEWFRSSGVHRQSNYPPFSLLMNRGPRLCRRPAAASSSIRFMVATHVISKLKLSMRIPKGFRLKAQGCRACEATLGLPDSLSTTLKGVAPSTRPSVHTEFQPPRNAHCNHQPSDSSPSPMPVPTRSGLAGPAWSEERVGERRPFRFSNLQFAIFILQFAIATHASQVLPSTRNRDATHLQ